MSIYSLELEKHVLAGLLKYPELYAEIAPFIKEDDFFNNTHQIIFSVLKRFITQSTQFDKILVGQTIKNMGISSIEDEINIFDYIEALFLIQINPQAFVPTVKELKKYSIRRHLHDKTIELQTFVKGAANEPLDSIIAQYDKICSSTNVLECDKEPIDLFEGLEERIERLSNEENAHEIIVPYPNYQKLYGGYFPGNLIIYAAYKKAGKTSLILDIFNKCCNLTGQNVKGLIIDTEMRTNEIQDRALASLAGINEYYLKSGKWRNNPELVQKVRSMWPIIKNYFKSIDHIYVGNTSIDEVIAIIRRWHLRKIKNSKYKALIAYDYFKLMDKDDIKDAYIGSMKLGYKVDALKKLASELQCPIIAACQTNRSNSERRDSNKRNDSGGAIGLSEEMGKFADSIFLWQRKALDEIQECPGSHKLVPLFTRSQGEFAQGFNDLVKVPSHDGKGWTYKEDFINFNIENFQIKELNTYKQVIEQHHQILPEQPKTDNSL